MAKLKKKYNRLNSVEAYMCTCIYSLYATCNCTCTCSCGSVIVSAANNATNLNSGKNATDANVNYQSNVALTS